MLSRSTFFLALVCATALGAHAHAQTPSAAPPAPAEPAPAAPRPPLAEALKGMARAEYEAGKILYADGDYAGAAMKFERAYDEAKDPRLLWNIAAAEKNRRRYGRVYTLVERYLKEAGNDLNPAERAEAQALLETVRGFIGEVVVAVHPPGAEVFIDGQRIGVAPLPEPLRLEMGEREIRVVKPGFKEFVRKENVAGGTSSRVDVALRADVHEGRLRVVAAPGDDILVDGRRVGSGEWEGRLASGIHSVQVSAPGKRPYQSDVGVSDDQLATVRVTLESPPPELARSGMGPWPWVLGGVALAGLTVGAYFLFQPNDEGPPAPVNGSLDPGSVPLSLRFR